MPRLYLTPKYIQMRVVKEIPHSECKISVFSWNDKYLIKFEQGNLEQTYKISEWDILEEGDLNEVLNDEFINKVLERFKSMSKDLHEATQHL